MSSITQIYSNAERQVCYDCPDVGGNIEVSGKKMKVECRVFNKQGIIFETNATARENELFELGLIDIVDNGVDTSEFEYTPKWEFSPQSRGGGGLSKYDCGFDPQQLQYRKYRKYGYTEKLYVHHENCLNDFIGTEIQDLIFADDWHGEGYDPDNAFTDAILLTARQTIANAVAHNDIVGVFGGANKYANAYDGVLAQAYWAYTGVAFFQSIRFVVNETEFVSGTFLHAKYAGKQINLQYDSTLPTDATIERYNTRIEVYQRLVDWLNNEVLTESGRRYVDAVFIGNEIIVTSRWAERLVDLDMFIDANPTVKSWADCNPIGTVTAEVLQNNMSVDERPYLVAYRKYTMDTILIDLATDIHNATIDMPMAIPGQSAALFIDEKLWKNYRHALTHKSTIAVGADLSEIFEGRVYPLQSLSNTGLWFVTMVSETPSLRNIAHLVDNNTRGASIFVEPDRPCRNIKLAYETLHGVMVRDFRFFAANLLCSPFAETLKEPYEKTLKVLPCYDGRMRERFNDPVNQLANCQLEARFQIVDEYRNEALYALPDGSGGYVIYVLEQGDILPNGALPVYEIQIQDTTTGIPPAFIPTYQYTVTFDDGTEIQYNSQNPIIQYVGTAAGFTFNVVQSVSVGNCSSTFVASQAYGQHFPFEAKGACADVNLLLSGVLVRSNVYTMTKANFRAETVTVYVAGNQFTFQFPNVDVTASEAADIINTWLSNNGYQGTASAVGNNLTIVSSQVIFISSGATDFANEKLISLQDLTAWEQGDGIDTVEITVGAIVYTSLPLSLESTGFSDGSDVPVTVVLTTKLGCTFTVNTLIEGFAETPEVPFKNFSLSNQ
jgi:hypothetical protein